jgi:hypothetical protein
MKMNLAVSAVAARKPRRSGLLLVVILFLISYGLLTTLVVRQGRTINSQRNLIHLLFKDRIHLSAMKDRMRRNQGVTQAQTQIPLSQVPSSQIPLPQIPSPQIPSVETPSTQARSNQIDPKANAKAGRKSRKAEPRPIRPPEITDPSDMRRVSFSI